MKLFVYIVLSICLLSCGDSIDLDQLNDNSRLVVYAFPTKGDSIDIYVYEMDAFQYVVEYVDEQRKSATVFNSAALKQKNKYEVFLGGNHPQINIKTTNLNKKSLLIFKDSYANALIPFLLPYYQNITIVDPRYYSDDIEKLISDAQITDVLFLYNMNTFAADNSLAGVLIDE